MGGWGLLFRTKSLKCFFLTPSHSHQSERESPQPHIPSEEGLEKMCFKLKSKCFFLQYETWNLAPGLPKMLLLVTRERERERERADTYLPNRTAELFICYWKVNKTSLCAFDECWTSIDWRRKHNGAYKAVSSCSTALYWALEPALLLEPTCTMEENPSTSTPPPLDHSTPKKLNLGSSSENSGRVMPST